MKDAEEVRNDTFLNTLLFFFLYRALAIKIYLSIFTDVLNVTSIKGPKNERVKEYLK